MHFHILSVSEWRYVVANVLFDEYEDALVNYSALTNSLYMKALAQPFGVEEIDSIVKVADSGGAVVGNAYIALVLTRCITECQWISPTWN